MKHSKDRKQKVAAKPRTIHERPSFDIIANPQAGFSTWRDERDLISAVMNFADCESGHGAHVYAHDDFVVVSDEPMAYGTVCNLVHARLDEIDKAIAEEEAAEAHPRSNEPTLP